MKKVKKGHFTLNKKVVSKINNITGGGFIKESANCTMRCTIDPPCNSNTPECQLTNAPGCPDTN